MQEGLTTLSVLRYNLTSVTNYSDFIFLQFGSKKIREHDALKDNGDNESENTEEVKKQNGEVVKDKTEKSEEEDEEEEDAGEGDPGQSKCCREVEDRVLHEKYHILV